MISIITTVYNNKFYLKDALDSFINSCGNIEFEILIGIDNCKITLEYIHSIFNSLHPNIKIFFFIKK